MLLKDAKKALPVGCERKIIDIEILDARRDVGMSGGGCA